MRVNIVGGGIMGLCTAWALVRRGHEALVLEQARVPNPLGSSVDQSRMTRALYGECPEYGPMVEEARAAYATLFADLGESPYDETGMLAVCAREQDWTDLSRVQMEVQGIPFELLGAAETRRRFPFLAAETVRYALLARRGGVLHAERIVSALASHLGARVRAGARVVEIDADRAEVRLDSAERLSADALVVAAGPWVAELLPAFATRVSVHRQTTVYLQPPAVLGQAWAHAPCVVDFGGDAELFAVPPGAARALKIGYGEYGRCALPGTGREVDDGEAQTVLDRFRGHLVEVDGYRVRDARTCCYTVAAGGRFIAEPAGERSWVVSACSGHGFKFGAALGLRLADALLGSASAQETTRWAAAGQPLAGAGPAGFRRGRPRGDAG